MMRRLTAVVSAMLLLSGCIDTGPYYRNCAAAEEAGAAPLKASDPGYRLALDRNKDGVACE